MSTTPKFKNSENIFLDTVHISIFPNIEYGKGWHCETDTVKKMATWAYNTPGTSDKGMIKIQYTK